MKTLEIPVKFTKEDTIYTTKQVKLEKNCHICDGKGTIEFNNKTMRCPECMGKGKFASNKQINVVCDEPFVILKTKVEVNNDNKIQVKYNGRCGFSVFNRSEDNLFLTKEAAQNRCDKLNKERAWVNVSDIVIQTSFIQTQPYIDKIQSKLNHYKETNEFDNDIVIDKDNILQDGYINYLICKLLNINVIRAVVEDK